MSEVLLALSIIRRAQLDWNSGKYSRSKLRNFFYSDFFELMCDAASIDADQVRAQCEGLSHAIQRQGKTTQISARMGSQTQGRIFEGKLRREAVRLVRVGGQFAVTPPGQENERDAQDI